MMGDMRVALSTGVLFATVSWMEKGDGPAGRRYRGVSSRVCKGLPQLLRAGPVFRAHIWQVRLQDAVPNQSQPP
jgi:hypothetical protein